MLNGPFKNGLLNSFDSEIIARLNLHRVDLPVNRAKSNFPEITSDLVTTLSNNLVFLLLAHPRMAPARLEYINHGIITTNSVDCDCFGVLCCNPQ